MQIITEQKLTSFDFWSGAKNNADTLSYEQLEQLEDILKDIYPNGLDDTTLNDMMWFDFDTIKEWLDITEDEENE